MNEKRPPISTTINMAEPVGSALHPMSAQESLALLGTITFGATFIRDRLTFNLDSHAIAIDEWAMFVPEAYQDVIEPAVKAVSGKYIGMPFTRDTVHHLACDISGWVRANVSRRGLLPPPGTQDPTG